MNSFIILGADSTLAKFFVEKYGSECVIYNRNKCDITDSKNIERILKKASAKYLINFAAITDIDYAERHPEECFEVNSVAVHTLSELCKKYNIKLIHFSSDYSIHPVNVYGYSKFLSERLIDLKHHLVIRTSFYSSKYYILQGLLTGKVVNPYKNIFFNPISITRLVREIYKNKDKKGILNIFSDKKISKYNFAMKAAKFSKTNSKLIKPVIFSNKNREAQLPLNSFVMSDVKIDLEDDLKEFFLLLESS